MNKKVPENSSSSSVWRQEFKVNSIYQYDGVNRKHPWYVLIKYIKEITLFGR